MHVQNTLNFAPVALGIILVGATLAWFCGVHKVYVGHKCAPGLCYATLEHALLFFAMYCAVVQSDRQAKF